MQEKRAQTKAESQERNNGFRQSHQQMLDAAVRMIAEKGVEALSLAELARELNVNRTTIYYHFKNREQLVAEVKQWAAQQLTTGLDSRFSQQERIDYITRFALENADLVKLWIDDLLTGADIRECYPAWDELVAGMRQSFNDGQQPDIDAEVFCLNLLVTAIVAPRVFKNSVAPEESNDAIVSRYRKEHQRVLASDGLFAKGT
jgi:AcrR family transcriptional regulator